MSVKVIGAGLAGTEAAWQLLTRGIPVELWEMRPGVKSPAHHTGDFAELVCSNSLKADGLTSAAGLLKEEARRLGSLIMACADAARIPAGQALAVDRNEFSAMVTKKLEEHPLIRVRREEAGAIPESGITVLATGPLTSPRMTEALRESREVGELFFYDAAAPLLYIDSIDQSKGFWASRYDKGGGDYFNCPMTKEEYDGFYEALIDARLTLPEDFEEDRYFEACVPVEVLAKRGPKTLLFGPMKPVGLEDPRDGRRPYAVVQLRRDDKAMALVNMVGFQTRLARPEQERVFRAIPALAKAKFARYGMIHRNTYINSPAALLPDGRLRRAEHVFVAGQMTGVEGYIESTVSGLAAGINAALAYKGTRAKVFPRVSAIGSLLSYIIEADPENFQPMNINFALFPPLDDKIKDKKEKNREIARRALLAIDAFKIELDKEFNAAG